MYSISGLVCVSLFSSTLFLVITLEEKMDKEYPMGLIYCKAGWHTLTMLLLDMWICPLLLKMISDLYIVEILLFLQSIK